MASLISMRVVNANKVVLQLDKYEKDLHKKALELCKNLADDAKSTAQAEYAGYEGYDVGDYVKVETEDITQGIWHKGSRVVATGNPKEAKSGEITGNTVIFAEFGAGTMASDHPMSADFGFYPGSWSAYDAQQFYKFGAWEHSHNGKMRHYTYMRPTMAMFKAGLRARGKLYEFAQRIFNGGNG